MDYGWSHDEEVLKQAARLAEVLLAAITAPQGDKTELDPGPALETFRQAMDQDLDTPAALGVMENLAKDILEAANSQRAVTETQEALRSMGTVFGLQFDAGNPEARVLVGWGEHLKRF